MRLIDKDAALAMIEELESQNNCGTDGFIESKRIAYKQVKDGVLEMQEIVSMQEEPTSVWHDANTLPSDPTAVIVEHNEYSTSICRAEQMSRVKGAKWAYIEDLLKL